VAATLALRAGVSLARAARERQRAGERDRERRFGLTRGESLAVAMRRMALGQLDLAIETLDTEHAERSPGTAVHETRKALKRLRALVRVLRPELGEEIYAREDRALRQIADGLSGARDADVLLATLDALVERDRGRLSGRGGVLRLRAHLLSERERARRATMGDPVRRAQAVAELRACRASVATWQLSEREGIALVEPGLAHLYRQGRSRWRSLGRGRKDHTRAMHRWRKRVKDLRYAAQMLQRDPGGEEAPPEPSRRRRRRARRRRAQARRDAAWLRRLERRADALGELLGEEHDLAVLDEYVRTHDGRGRRGGPRVGKRSRRKLARSIAERRRVLRRAALRDGERLYRRSPTKFIRRVRRAQGPARQVS